MSGDLNDDGGGNCGGGRDLKEREDDKGAGNDGRL